MKNNYLLIRMLLVKYNREMGRRYCCVPGCSNTSQTVKDGTKVILHRLPMSGKKNNIKQQWIRSLRNVRADLIINDNTRVCSDHFEGVFTNNSVPTIFPSKPKVHSRERRPLIRHGNIVCNSRVPLNELKTGALGEVDFDTSKNQENLSVHVQETQSESCYMCTWMQKQIHFKA